VKTRDLTGRRIAALVADGFEKMELAVPLKALKAAGAKVDLISLRKGRIRGMNLHEPAGKFRVTKTVFEAKAADYDGLFIPGGFINPDLLRQSAEARTFVRLFDEQQKPIATLCHGPWVLASSGVLKGRTLTSWPGIRDDLVNAGATWLNQETVRDGNLVTSRGPQDIVPFVAEIKELFAATIPILPERVPSQKSAPQADAPPATILATLKWMPRPSFRTAAAFLVLAAAIVAKSRPRKVAPIPWHLKTTHRKPRAAPAHA